MIFNDWRIWFFIMEIAIIPAMTRYLLRWGITTGKYDQEIEYIASYSAEKAWRHARGATGGATRSLKKVQFAIDEAFTEGILRNIMPYLKFLGLDDILEDVENPQAIMEIVAQNIHRFPNAWAFIENLLSGRVHNLVDQKEQPKSNDEGGWSQ